MAGLRSAARSAAKYAIQRIVSLSVVALFVFLYFALRSQPRHDTAPVHSLTFLGLSFGTPSEQESASPARDVPAGTSSLRALFSFYSIFVHILAAVFPVRACLAVRYITRQVRKAKSELRTSPAASPLYISEKNPLDNTLLHVIIIPNYKEDVDTLRATMAVLASHAQAQTSYHVGHIFFRNTQNSRCFVRCFLLTRPSLGHISHGRS